MKERIRTHKSRCNITTTPQYNNKTYKMMRANGGWDNFKFINLGNIKNVTKTEARHTEQAFINLFKPNMNTINSYITKEQKKEQQKPVRKEYYQNNKEKIAAYEKEYCEKNKEQKKEYDKEYREKNKEKKAADSKAYREKNKVTCECGCVLTKNELTRHKQTTKHINLMKNDELQILN